MTWMKSKPDKACLFKTLPSGAYYNSAIVGRQPVAWIALAD
jgi:hypothetical protein